MKFISLFVTTLLAINFCSQAQAPERLRYFMQEPSLQASAVPYGANAEAGRYVQSGGARIYYEVYGSGKPLVVLHGGVVGSSYEMGQLIDSLSSRYQVIVVSTRGHGKSEMGSGLPTYQQKAADVHAVIDTVSRDSVTVLGFSDGAYTGYFLAALHPKKIKKLIAIGAGEWKKDFRTFNFSRQELFRMDSLYFSQQLSLMPQPQRFDEWLSSLNRVYNSMSVGKEIFSVIKCPVLVMAGERDGNAPLRTVIAAYEMISNAQLSIIPIAPHPVFLVNFQAVWASLLPFLQQ